MQVPTLFVRMQYEAALRSELYRELNFHPQKIVKEEPHPNREGINVLQIRLPYMQGNGLYRVLNGEGYRDCILSLERSESLLTSPLPNLGLRDWTALRLSPYITHEGYDEILGLLKSKGLNVEALPDDGTIARDGPIVVISCFSSQVDSINRLLSRVDADEHSDRRVVEIAPYEPPMLRPRATVEFQKPRNHPGDWLALRTKLGASELYSLVPSTNIPGGRTKYVRIANRDFTRIESDIEIASGMSREVFESLITHIAEQAGFEAAVVEVVRVAQ